MRVSGHSQPPVRGLKARPGSHGIQLAVTRDYAPDIMTLIVNS